MYKKKIDLIPEKCNGAKVRYATEGWGLVQFQLWLKDTGLLCDIGANSEKRAKKNAVRPNGMTATVLKSYSHKNFYALALVLSCNFTPISKSLYYNIKKAPGRIYIKIFVGAYNPAKEYLVDMKCD